MAVTLAFVMVFTGIGIGQLGPEMAWAAEETETEIASVVNAIATDYANNISKNSYWQVMELAALNRELDITGDAKSEFVNNAIADGETKTSATDLAKYAISLSALGIDVTNLPSSDGGTYNLIDRIAASNVSSINAAVFALQAYDSNNYFPTAGVDRELLISTILNKQLEDGGWAFSGTSGDPDMTGMAICALAPYYNKADYVSKKVSDDTLLNIEKAVTKGISLLSQIQNNDGTYSSWGTKNANSCAIVILALSSVGIDAGKDSRFIKDNKSAIDGLFAFKIADKNGFGYNGNTTLNASATEQAFRALVSYQNSASNEDFSPYNIYKYDGTAGGGTSSGGSNEGESIVPIETYKKNVSIRIEGKTDTLYNNTITVEHSGVICKVSDCLTTLNSLDKDIAIVIENGSWGPYVSSIGGEAEEGYYGWSYLVNGISPSVGVGEYNVTDGDEIVLYYGGYPMAFPQISMTYDNGTAILKFETEYTDWSSGTPVTFMQPISDATICFGYGENERRNFTTDSDGKIVIEAEYATGGEHSLQIDKKDQNGIPTVLRFPADYKLTLANQIMISNVGHIIEIETNDTIPQIYYIDANINDALLKVNGATGSSSKSVILPETKIIKNYSGGTISVVIPANTKVTVNKKDWDGSLILPAVTSYSQQNIETKLFVEMGVPDAKVTTSNYVSLEVNKEVDAKSFAYIDENKKLIDITGFKNENGLFTAQQKRIAPIALYKPKTATDEPQAPTTTSGYVYLSIKGTNGIEYLTDKAIPYESGQTALSILINEDSTALIKNTEYGKYVYSIRGLAEFDRGPKSGWMYSVNGVFPGYSAELYQLKDKDVVQWVYTMDLGADVGNIYVPDQSSVTTSGTSGSATTTTPTEVTVSGDTAKATIKTENASEAIKQAKEKKSAEIVIEVANADIKNAEKVQVEIPTATAKEVINTTTADLTVKTPIGTVTIPRDTLKEAVAEAKGTTITLEVAAVSKPTDTQKKAAGTNGQIISVTIKSGSTVISTFGGKSLKLKAEVPAKLMGKKIVAIHIAADGTVEKMQGELIKEGTKEYYEFSTPHLSTFALVDADEIGLEEKDEEANVERIKELVSDMSLKASSSKTSKKNIKVALTVHKDTAAAIKEIEDMGYTVKYKYYRSTRKASKYQSKITKTTRSFTNTAGKKGTKYYYKARIQVYDKDGKLVAQTALKQCRYAARTWTK